MLIKQRTLTMVCLGRGGNDDLTKWVLKVMRGEEARRRLDAVVRVYEQLEKVQPQMREMMM